MYTIEAIYDGNTFNTTQPIGITEEYKVIITFVEPVKRGVRKTSKHLVEPDPSKSGAIALGLWNGKMKVPDDFNDPLDDLKEYMY